MRPSQSNGEGNLGMTTTSYSVEPKGEVERKRQLTNIGTDDRKMMKNNSLFAVGD